MPYRYLFFLLLNISLCSCTSTTTTKPEKISPQKDSLSLAIKTNNLSIYTLPTVGIIDSTLMQNTRFIAFKTYMEDLNKLNPEGIEPFVIEALKACQRVERSPLPTPFDAPDISARLKVVKTQLIKVRYFTQERNQEGLDTALADLYTAYNDYLKRIHSFAEEASFEEGEIQLNTTY